MRSTRSTSFGAIAPIQIHSYPANGTGSVEILKGEKRLPGVHRSALRPDGGRGRADVYDREKQHIESGDEWKVPALFVRA